MPPAPRQPCNAATAGFEISCSEALGPHQHHPNPGIGVCWFEGRIQLVAQLRSDRVVLGRTAQHEMTDPAVVFDGDRPPIHHLAFCPARGYP
ncbi:MAG: hypothetical protein FJW88_01380 [Actinobacteria bacterium]|nr:hypothetical protein [Actinomycetota bacterium]